MAKKEERPNMLQKLKEDIRQDTPGRLYFFYCEEIFLLNHYLKQLHKNIIDPITESFNFHKLTGETFDIQSFAGCVENLPMMAERTMTIVDEVDIFKLGEADRDRMAEILSDIPDYCTVVFTYETVPFKPDKRFAKLWNVVDNNGMLVEFEKQNQRDLIAWIGRHFASSGKRITNDLCAYLDENPYCIQDPGIASLQPVGSMEYRNFLFTTSSGTKILSITAWAIFSKSVVSNPSPHVSQDPAFSRIIRI